MILTKIIFNCFEKAKEVREPFNFLIGYNIKLKAVLMAFSDCYKTFNELIIKYYDKEKN